MRVYKLFYARHSSGYVFVVVVVALSALQADEMGREGINKEFDINDQDLKLTTTEIVDFLSPEVLLITER